MIISTGQQGKQSYFACIWSMHLLQGRQGVDEGAQAPVQGFQQLNLKGGADARRQGSAVGVAEDEGQEAAVEHLHANPAALSAPCSACKALQTLHACVSAQNAHLVSCLCISKTSAAIVPVWQGALQLPQNPSKQSSAQTL